jgi:hypothetical protein
MCFQFLGNQPTTKGFLLTLEHLKN